MYKIQRAAGFDRSHSATVVELKLRQSSRSEHELSQNEVEARTESSSRSHLGTSARAEEKPVEVEVEETTQLEASAKTMEDPAKQSERHTEVECSLSHNT